MYTQYINMMCTLYVNIHKHVELCKLQKGAMMTFTYV